MSRIRRPIPRIVVGTATSACLAVTLLLVQPVAAQATAAKPASVRIAGYSGEQLANARAIVAVAGARHLPVAAAVLGVATAMGESSLRNLPYGDNAINPDGTVADSIGLFQQQHWWGSRTARMTPSSAANAFYQHLERVRGWERMAPTAAIHRVQGNADPDYYTRFVPAAIEVVSYLVKHPGRVAAATGSSPSGSSGRARTATGTTAKDATAVAAAKATTAYSGATKQAAAAARDLKRLAAVVAAATEGTDFSDADWATDWDLGSVDDAISGAFADGLGVAGGTLSDGPAADGSATEGSAADGSAPATTVEGSSPDGPGSKGAASDGSGSTGSPSGGPASKGSGSHGSAPHGPASHGSAPGGSVPED